MIAHDDVKLYRMRTSDCEALHLLGNTVRFAMAVAIVTVVVSVSMPAFVCKAQNSQQSTLKLALQWLPQSQFAGYYAARDMGFYGEEGLDIDFIHTGPGKSSLDYLVENKADFATLFLTDAIVNTGNPPSIVHVAQIIQISNLMLVAWKDAGIEQPTDLAGKTVSCWPGAFSLVFEAFFGRYSVNPRLVPQNQSVNLFFHRGVEACAAMIYNEFNQIHQSGVDSDDLTLLLMRDYGLGYPEDGIYTTSEFAANRPDICEALARATMRGWEYARQNQDEAIDMVIREAEEYGVPVNRSHSRWMLQQVLASIFTDDETGAGILSRDDYKNAASALLQARLLEQAPEFGDFAPLAGNRP